MEDAKRSNQAKRIASVAFALLVTGQATAWGQSPVPQDRECLVKVKVMGTDGTPFRHALVEVVDSAGHVVLTTRSTDGVAELCDAGFGEYSVRVMGTSCLPTVISRVWFRPGNPLDLVAVVNSCEYIRDNHSACEAYFRVQTAEGKPIAFPRAVSPVTNWNVVGDRYGRITFPLRMGREVTIRLEAPGFAPQPATIRCESVEEIERRVVLGPAQSTSPRQ